MSRKACVGAVIRHVRCMPTSDTTQNYKTNLRELLQSASSGNMIQPRTKNSNAVHIITQAVHQSVQRDDLTFCTDGLLDT